MKKFSSELYEAMYDGFLYDFKAGRISEAEFREFEADAFIEVVGEGEKSNEVTEELISLSQSLNQK